jgi:hypothetical protein
MRTSLSLVVYMLFCMMPLFSLPLGNPSTSRLFPCEKGEESRWHYPARYRTIFSSSSIQIGYYGDFVANRYLEIETTGEVIPTTQIQTQAGYISISCSDRITFFGTYGASCLRLRTIESSWTQTPNATLGMLYTDTAPSSWSVGSQITLIDVCCFSLGIEGQYFYAQPHLISYLEGAAWQDFLYFNPSPPTHYAEWQVGAGLSYRIQSYRSPLAFIPYIGIKRSGTRFHMYDYTFHTGSETLTLYTLSAHKRYGYAVGATCVVQGKIGVTVEGRFADESALSINGQMCF